MTNSSTDSFERERSRLTSLAYRMLGEHAGAEDIVQDVWLRWNNVDQEDVRNPTAWLTTATTRIAIDELRSARSRRETYVGPWLPEPEITQWADGQGPDTAIEQQGEVSLALLWAMERLAPEERAAFLLREAFDVEYASIAEALDKSEAACRKLVSRAKSRLQETRPRFEADPAEVEALLGRFMTATATVDRAEIMDLLTPDVLAISDGGGLRSAALRPLEGAEDVATVWLAVAGRNELDAEPQMVWANGMPALAILGEGENDLLLTVLPDQTGRIAWLYVMRNPEKLAAALRASKS